MKTKLKKNKKIVIETKMFDKVGKVIKIIKRRIFKNDKRKIKNSL